jgi:uncharacterized protein
MSDQLSRRQLFQNTALTAAGIAAGAAMSSLAFAEDPPEVRRTRSYSPAMEYRRLGKTGLWLSAVCMGGHWKRIDKAIGSGNINPYAQPAGEVLNAFDQNRHDVISRCIDQGINLIDACTGGEVMAYSKALRGRREKMFIAYSWYEKEMRNAPWRTAEKLLQGLDEGLKASGLEYVDIWRITCHEKGSNHTEAEVQEMIKALDTARGQGKCRFTGFSSHDRPWIKMMIETYPQTVQVVVTPYHAKSKVLPADSVFAAARTHDVGVLGIKPFASNSLFKGDSSPTSPTMKEDDEVARLAIRYILANPAITAPIPGLISLHQVDNVAQAIKERRELDKDEQARLERAAEEMYARLPADYQWLKDWENA